MDEILTRAGRPDYTRWAEQVDRCGQCARPVRLRGRVARRHPDGRRDVWSTSTEPDRVLLVRCGNRRAVACPSCSREYAGDLWQLLYAGAAGGRKGVPETVRTHPLVFATLTAPGFGAVHTTRAGGLGCHPGARLPCPHGRPTACPAVHPDDDAILGRPLCARCYDYAGHVAFNWHGPELWRRFTIALRRVLARRAGLSAAAFDRRCRVSFVKVAEFQRRAVVHFHALVRLDAPGAGHTPPGVPADADELADAIVQAAAHVRLPIDLPGGPRMLTLGRQVDTQTVHTGPVRQMTPERVAAYIAKYATKSAEDFGLGDRRISPDALPLLGLSDHVEQLVRTCWDLGGHGDYAGIRRWLHMLGFRGHFASKSRHYSTTLGAIREERREHQRRHAPDRLGAVLTDPHALVTADWSFAGLGHLTAGDAALAASASRRARERRAAARENRA